MKKMEYIAPEEQIVKLQLKNALLVGSGEEGDGDMEGGETF
jgi:hypothetical protein